ncbi:MAG: Uncharacterised protein [Prochlorococcus marinus str. MIT 9313]|nr:MAG: Uncharacterised protein [Prochlorococcus marinus str. MIT 9313]
MAVLAFTTCLTGKLALAFRAGTNGFPVGDLRSADVGLHLEFSQHAIHENFKVEFAHTSNHGLTGLRVCADAEGGILFR